MKVRNSKDLIKALSKKGFKVLEKDHHYYWLYVNGLRTHIWTEISHNNQDYSKELMGLIKKQLKFKKSIDLENYLDCIMSYEEYIQMLTKHEEL